MNHILINGCSHSAGSEIEGSGIGESNFNRENCFGAQFAKKLNVSYTNLASPGAGNDYICRNTVFWCLNNSDRIKDTLFLIHWTSPWRMEYFVDDHIQEPDLFWQDVVYDKNVGFVTGGDRWNNFLKEDQKIVKRIQKNIFLKDTHWHIQKYLNVIYLQTILKNFKARYIFKNGFDPLPLQTRYDQYSKKIDTKNFVNPFSEDGSFFEHCLQAGHNINGQEFWHHKLPAHTYWANKLYTEFKELFPA